MAYEGPKGPWSDIETLTVDFNLINDENTKFEYQEYEPDHFTYLIANSTIPTNILVKFEKP